MEPTAPSAECHCRGRLVRQQRAKGIFTGWRRKTDLVDNQSKNENRTGV